MSPKTSPRQSPKASYISATRHHVRRKNSLKHARSEMGTSTRIQLPVRVKQEVGSPEEEMAVLLHDGYSNHSNHSTHVSQAVSSESLLTSLTASVISSQPSDVKIPPQATAVRHVKVPTPSALLPPPYKSKSSSKIPLQSVRTPQEAMETILIVPKSCVSNKFHPKTELGRVIKQENSSVKKNPSRTVDPLRVTQKMYTKPSQTPCVVTAAQSVKASDEIPTKVVVINSTTPTSITGMYLLIYLSLMCCSVYLPVCLSMLMLCIINLPNICIKCNDTNYVSTFIPHKMYFKAMKHLFLSFDMNIVALIFLQNIFACI